MPAERANQHESGSAALQGRTEDAGVSALLRLRVAMNHAVLDAQLARGADRLGRPGLALRAAQLESRQRRRALARTLRRLVAEATGPLPPARATAVIIARPQVRAHRDALLVLADRLDSPGPAHVEGIAIAQLLVSDALVSPIYVQSERGLLGSLVRQAIACMDGPTETPVRWPSPPSPRLDERPDRGTISTVLLSEHSDGDRVTARRVRTRDRLLARLHTDRLDRALAAGTTPDSDPQLSLRAHRLIGVGVRRDLSREVGSLGRAARRPRNLYDPEVPLRRRKIINADELLRKLASRLLAPGPVNAGGVARVRLLLRDGSGPLYTHPGADDLTPALQAAIDGLDVWD